MVSAVHDPSGLLSLRLEMETAELVITALEHRAQNLRHAANLGSKEAERDRRSGLDIRTPSVKIVGYLADATILEEIAEELRTTVAAWKPGRKPRTPTSEVTEVPKSETAASLPIDPPAGSRLAADLGGWSPDPALASAAASADEARASQEDPEALASEEVAADV